MATGARRLPVGLDTNTGKLVVGDGNDYAPVVLPPYGDGTPVDLGNISGGGGAGGGLWVDVAYSNNVPFNTNAVMPQQILTAATTFTPILIGSAAGATCYVRLVSNGSVMPVFSGFKQDASSHGWGAANGTLNRVAMWFDGDDYWYSIQQEAGLPVVIPVFADANINADDASKIVLTYSVALDPASVPSPTAFAVTNSGAAYSVTGVAVSGSTVSLTTNRPALSGEVVTVSYTPPGSGMLKSSTGGVAASLTDESVQNNLVGLDGLLFNSLSGFNVTESAGYKNYEATLSTWNNKAAQPSKKLTSAPSTDQYFEVTLYGLAPGIALHTDATSSVGIGDAAHWIYKDGTSYNFILAGGTWSAVNSITAADGDRLRFRRTQSNAMFMEVSKDNGQTWTIRAQASGITGDLFPRINCGSPSNVNAVKCNGVAV